MVGLFRLFFAVWHAFRLTIINNSVIMIAYRINKETGKKSRIHLIYLHTYYTYKTYKGMLGICFLQKQDECINRLG